MALSEKELDRILGRALRTDDEFLSWFLHRSGFPDVDYRRVLIRDDWPWGKPRGDQTKFRETDILVVCEATAVGRIAVHIENKGPRRKFAQAWAGVEKWGAYTTWKCVLVAPKAYVERSPVERSFFDEHLPYEELAVHLSAFWDDVR